DDARPVRTDVLRLPGQDGAVDVLIADHGDVGPVAVDHADEAGAVQALLPVRACICDVLAVGESPGQAHVFVEVGAFAGDAVGVEGTVAGLACDLCSFVGGSD